MKAYPLRFTPIFKERIWGGQRLRTALHKDIPPNRKIGESWELVDLPDDRTLVADGPLAGRTLREAVAMFGRDLTGPIEYEPPFPIQTRYINAEDILSVQVHPGPEACRRLGRGAPKTETWYLIDAAPGAFLYKGLRAGVDETEVRVALRDGTVAELLVKVPVAAGECHHIPTGAVHAIGPGILIAEVQTPSDTTYRLFDWNRRDADGHLRQLHVEEALASIRWDLRGSDLAATTGPRLAACEHYALDRRTGGRDEPARIGGSGWPTVVTIVAGSGLIRAAGGTPARFRTGDTLLIPAAFDGRAEFDGECTFLEASVPA